VPLASFGIANLGADDVDLHDVASVAFMFDAGSSGAIEIDPLVAGWFAERFAAPTPPRPTVGARSGRPGRADRRAHGLGKTLAAFLWAIDRLVRTARTGWLTDETTVVSSRP
jgi:hypothetical protein